MDTNTSMGVVQGHGGKGDKTRQETSTPDNSAGMFFFFSIFFSLNTSQIRDDALSLPPSSPLNYLRPPSTNP